MSKIEILKKIRFVINATDTALFTVDKGKLMILLIPITSLPKYKGYWGLPGGLINPKETADQAAKRHLRHKGGAHFQYIEQLYTFSKVKRDPRGRVVSTAYIAAVSLTKMKLKQGANAQWFSVRNLPKLAYDHKEIVTCAVERLKTKLEYTNFAFAFLPQEFTLAELQKVYEIILSKKLDKRNFQKKLFVLNLLRPLRRTKKGLAHRLPQLYKFKDSKLKVMEVI